MKLWTVVKEIKSNSGEKALQFTEHHFSLEIFKRVFKDLWRNDISLLTSLKVSTECAHSTITWAVLRF